MKYPIFCLAIFALLTQTGLGAGDAEANAYLDGLNALGAGKYSDADRSFSQAISSNEDNPAYYQARGVARTVGESFSGAISDLQRAGRMAPAGDWETSAWLAIANKMNNHPEVTFAPGTAPRADQPYAIALNDMGQRYWQSRYRGSYTDPVQRKTIQTAEPYKGDFAKIAATYAQRHMGAQGADPNVLLTRIQGQIQAGQYQQALPAIDALLAASPGNPELILTKAQILLALDAPKDARTLYTDVLTRRASAAAYIGRANAAARMGDLAHAVKDIAQAAKMDSAAAAAAQKQLPTDGAPANPSPQTNWTLLETQCQSNAPAAQIDQTATAIVRQMAAARIRYDERYQERLAALESDLKANPDDPNRMAMLARFLYDNSTVLEERVGPRAEPKTYRAQSDTDLKHDLDRANFLVDTALQQHPDNVAALTTKAHIRIDQADYDGAQALVVKALAVKKNDPDLLECLASLVQIQAARHISAAANLRLPNTWYETHFDEYPPMEYKYTLFPSKQDLQRAAALERQAEKLSKLAQEQLEQASTGAGPTAQGWYYRAALQRVRGDSAGAKESLTKAITLQPDFQPAWLALAGICTDLRDGDGAIAARARAYNLVQTTASAQLNALWYKISHDQFKTARDTVAQGVQLDPSDPKLPAYLAVIDEAAEKPDDALAHYRMSRALSDAHLVTHGARFSGAGSTLAMTASDAAFPAAVRLRIACLLFDAGKPADAANEFALVSSALAAYPAVDPNRAAPDALLPSADLPAGTVPPAEPIGFLQIRANAGAAYAKWATTARTPADVELAAKTYHRLLVSYMMPTDTLDALKAIADLGLAELYVQSRQFPEAEAAMQSTPAVPQDFWQEMRRTESAVRAQR